MTDRQRDASGTLSNIWVLLTRQLCVRLLVCVCGCRPWRMCLDTPGALAPDKQSVKWIKFSICEYLWISDGVNMVHKRRCCYYYNPELHPPCVWVCVSEHDVGFVLRSRSSRHQEFPLIALIYLLLHPTPSSLNLSLYTCFINAPAPVLSVWFILSNTPTPLENIL